MLFSLQFFKACITSSFSGFVQPGPEIMSTLMYNLDVTKHLYLDFYGFCPKKNLDVMKCLMIFVACRCNYHLEKQVSRVA